MNKRLGIFSLILVGAMTLGSITAFAEPKEQGMLVDDYNRADLMTTTNTKGITLYWFNQSNCTPSIDNNALKLEMNAEGWFGEAGAVKDPAYKYMVMRIKGQNGGEEASLSINPDAKGGKAFKDLIGADGKPVPAITTEYQDIVIDIAASGFNLPDGFEALHFNNSTPVTVYIDDITLLKAIGDASTSTETTTENKPTTEQNNTTTEEKKEEVVKPTFDDESESSSNKVVLLGGIAVAALIAIGGAAYFIYGKKK